jgi:hypothetical protein
MTTNEIKLEIQKSLDRVPESTLNEILALLKQAERNSEEKVNLARNLRHILEEDKNLLDRLAK